MNCADRAGAAKAYEGRRRTRRMRGTGWQLPSIKHRALIGSALTACTAFLLGCTSAKPDHARLQASGVPARLWVDGQGRDLPFDEYMRAAQATIREHRHRIPGESQDDHLERAKAVAPRQWLPGRACQPSETRGVLLVHGLTDSPYLMRDIGDALARKLPSCTLVRSLLLPGHGTRPGDLSGTRYTDWIEAVRYGIDSFGGSAREVHMVGFSTGAALTLYWALSPKRSERAAPVSSLVLISPAVRPAGLLAQAVLLPRLYNLYVMATGRGSWMSVHEDVDYAKYESFSFNAGYQLYLLDELLAGFDETALQAPVFMALSRDDATVNTGEAIDFFLKTPNPSNRMLLWTRLDSKDEVVDKASADARAELIEARQGRVGGDHADYPSNRMLQGAPHRSGDKVVDKASADARVELIGSRLPTARVLSFSHTSLPTREDNPHYGRAGDYADCLWYDRGQKWASGAKHCACITEAMRAARCPAASGSQQGEIWYGERNEQDAKTYVLRRLSFNPHFERMVDGIDKFIQGTERR